MIFPKKRDIINMMIVKLKTGTFPVFRFDMAIKMIQKGDSP